MAEARVGKESESEDVAWPMHRTCTEGDTIQPAAPGRWATGDRASYFRTNGTQGAPSTSTHPRLWAASVGRHTRAGGQQRRAKLPEPEA